MKAGFAALLVAAAVACSAPAKAQVRAGGASNDSAARAHADAEQRLTEGLARYDRSDFDGARLAFQQAYSVLPSLDLLYDLARAEFKSGHALEALVHARQLLRDPSATTEDREKAERLCAELGRVVGHILVEAPTGAEIVIDGVPYGSAPAAESFEVAPGKHVVEVRTSDQTRRAELQADAGRTATAHFVFETQPVPEHPRTTPGHPPIEAPVGAESNARVLVPVILGVAAVLVLSGGLVVGMASQHEEAQADNYRASHAGGFCYEQSSATCQAYASILNSQQTDTDVSRGLLIGGGVLAVGGLVTYLAWPRRNKERGAYVTPTLGGVVVGGAF